MTQAPILLAPKHLLVDYVEMVILGSTFCFGVATNVWALVGMTANPYRTERRSTELAPLNTSYRNSQLVISPARASVASSSIVQTRRRSDRPVLNSSQRRLQFCLLVSNLLVLIVYCPFKVFWLATYQWVLGGGFGCKLVHFLFMFVFCLSSNLIACIALNRATTIRRLLLSTACPRPSLGVAEKVTVVMPALSVVLAALGSVWQLAVFDVVTAKVNNDREIFVQCVTVWDETYLHTLGLPRGAIGDRVLAALGVTAAIYGFFHLIVVFCAPFALIVGSYAYVVVRLFLFSDRPMTPTFISASPAPTRPVKSRLCSLPSTDLVTFHQSRPSAIAEQQLSLLSPLRANADGQTSSFQSGTIIPEHVADNRASLVKSRFSSLPSPDLATFHQSRPSTIADQQLSLLSPLRANADGQTSSFHSGTIDTEQAANSRASTDQTHLLSPYRSTDREESGHRFSVSTGTRTSAVSEATVRQSAVPVWRRQMRGRMFRTSGTIVVCYLLFWMPYTVICVTGLLVPAHREPLSDYSGWLQCLIVLNSVVNPLLYKFK